MNPAQEISPPLKLDYARPAPRPLVAVGLLVLCCLFWGYSFPVIQISTTAFDRHVLEPAARDETAMLASRGMFNGVRFGLAALLYLGLTFRTQRAFARAEVVGGAVVGALFGAGTLFQVSGLRWALPSVSSFLTALPVVFAPLAQSLLFRRRVGPRVWLAVAAAAVGIVLLSWPKPDATASAGSLVTVPPVPYLGEAFTVLAALLFTAQIMAVDHFGRRANPMRITFVMLATTAVVSLLTAAILGGGNWRPGAASGLTTDATVGWTFSTLIVFSSVCALHLMNVYQPYVSPATASVIYCTEPLFSTLFSLLFATETLVFLTVAGGAAVVASVYIVASGPTPAPPSSRAEPPRAA